LYGKGDRERLVGKLEVEGEEVGVASACGKSDGTGGEEGRDGDRGGRNERRGVNSRERRLKGGKKEGEYR